MSEGPHKSHTKEYMLVFLALAIFTASVIELVIPELRCCLQRLQKQLGLPCGEN